jgi:hypothetical protein
MPLKVIITSCELLGASGFFEVDGSKCFLKGKKAEPGDMSAFGGKRKARVIRTADDDDKPDAGSNVATPEPMPTGTSPQAQQERTY